MTTATVQFDLNHPTLFKEGRFTRDEPPAAERSPATERPARATAPAPRHAPASRGRLTLDDVLTAAWDDLAAHHSVTCPVCSGSMAPRYGSGAQPVGGRCTRCGSTLG
jgi:hypothetical protein